MDVRRRAKNAGSPPAAAAFEFLRRPRQPAPLAAADAPALSRPIMICAFEGWNDAGEAASFAAAHLAETWKARPFAEIDSDEFFDFTEVRPETIVTESGRRRIVWPSTSFSVARNESGAPDIVVVRGPEPQLRWQAYTAALVELAVFLKIERVVTLGAYLGEVTHGRAVPVNASTNDPELSRSY
jgi:proteasome assembly chaperone (PAC2) family protein